MTGSLQFGMVIWAGATALAGVLAVRSRRLGRFPALRVYFWFTFLAQPVLMPLFVYGNSWYGPYWYGRNAYEAVETFLLSVVLAELLDEAPRGVVVGVLLASGAFLPFVEALNLTQSALAVVAGILSLLDDDRAHVAQGVFALLALPLIATFTELPTWSTYVPTLTAILSMGIWFLALPLLAGGKRPRAIGAANGG